MDNEGKFWLVFWTIIMLGVVACVGIGGHNYWAIRRMAFQHNYCETMAPGHSSPLWMKCP